MKNQLLCFASVSSAAFLGSLLGTVLVAKRAHFAPLSREAAERQHQWNVKRETLLATVAALNLAYYALVHFWSISARNSPRARSDQNQDDFSRAASDYVRKSEVFEHQAGQTAVVCPTLEQAMLKTGQAMHQAFYVAMDGHRFTAEAFDAFQSAYLEARALAHQELRLPIPAEDLPVPVPSP